MIGKREGWEGEKHPDKHWRGSLPRSQRKEEPEHVWCEKETDGRAKAEQYCPDVYLLTLVKKHRERTYVKQQCFPEAGLSFTYCGLALRRDCVGHGLHRVIIRLCIDRH